MWPSLCAPSRNMLWGTQKADLTPEVFHPLIPAPLPSLIPLVMALPCEAHRTNIILFCTIWDSKELKTAIIFPHISDFSPLTEIMLFHNRGHLQKFTED